MLLQSAADQFEFSDNYAEDALAEAMPERIDFDQIPVDAENPGFASLLPALLGVRDGAFGLEVLDGYLMGLYPRLDMARQQLASLEIPEAIREQVGPAMAATAACLDEMAIVLELVDHFLQEGVADSLDEAIERLARIHNELKQAL